MVQTRDYSDPISRLYSSEGKGKKNLKVVFIDYSALFLLMVKIFVELIKLYVWHYLKLDTVLEN